MRAKRMRVLIISDIHGNYHALKTVVEKVPHDAIICCGDLVDGFPYPEECVNYVIKKCRHVCAGNHDYLVGLDQKISDVLPEILSIFFPLLERAKALTMKVISEKSRKYLRTIPVESRFVLDGVSFYMQHTVPNESLWFKFDGRLSESKTTAYYKDIQSDILITAHTHFPYVQKVGDQLLVNPGSIGEARDGDPRAGFAVFDTRSRKLELGRMDYEKMETEFLMEKLCFPKIMLDSLITGRIADYPEEA